MTDSHRSWEAATLYSAGSSSTSRHLSAKQQVYCCCFAVPRCHSHPRAHHHAPMGSDCDGVDYDEPCHCCPRICSCGIQQAQPRLVSSKTSAVGVCVKILRAVDGREHRQRGGKATPPTHSIILFSLVPTTGYHAPAWAEVLRCDELHDQYAVVQGGSEKLSEALTFA